MSRWVRAVHFCVMLLLLSGCDQPPSIDKRASTAAPDAAPEVTALLSQESQTAIDSLCALLHTMPAKRKSECCGHAAPDLAEACKSALTQPMLRGEIAISGGDLSACTAQIDSSLAGCDWVSPLTPVPPKVCLGLITGNLAAGATCTTSLACAADHYCQGMRAGATGRCVATAKPGNACETINDSLAILTAEQDQPTHRTCAGLCLRGQCLAVNSEGGQCASNAFCESGLNCLGGICSSQSLASEGAACDLSESCRAGFICSAGLCSKPKTAGAACTTPFECRSLACDKKPEQTAGICADVCTG